MRTLYTSLKVGAAALVLASSAACSGAGGLGSVLGSVLGGAGQQQQGGQLTGFVNGVNTQNRQIGIQQQNGQTVAIAYDQNTQVSYQNQSYPVSALENGDQVTLRVQQLQNGGYYTDLIQVDQSVRSTGGGQGPVYQTGNVQSLEGSVRSVNRTQGFFVMNLQNGQQVTVTLPAQVSRNDVTRFNALRAGEFVRFYGVVTGNSNVELRQFQ
jgi:hypothetical protein